MFTLTTILLDIGTALLSESIASLTLQKSYQNFGNQTSNLKERGKIVVETNARPKSAPNVLMVEAGVSPASLEKLNRPKLDQQSFRRACHDAMMEVRCSVPTKEDEERRDSVMGTLLTWWKRGSQ